MYICNTKTIINLKTNTNHYETQLLNTTKEINGYKIKFEVRFLNIPLKILIMYVDFKITTWERVNISTLTKKQQQEFLVKIKNGTISTSNDLFNEADKQELNPICEILFETEKQMTLEENEGNSTIEVFSLEGESLYENDEE